MFYIHDTIVKKEVLMKSMTGFGRSSITMDGLQCTMEIKSVNARFLDLSIRLPKQLNGVEHIIRHCIQEHLHRGKVDVFVTLQEIGDSAKSFRINRILKEQIQHLLVEEGFYNDSSSVPLQATLAISNEWIQIEESTLSQELLETLAENMTKEAVQALLTMRQYEGNHIKDDMINRLSHMESIVVDIDKNKLNAVENYRTHLQSKIQDQLVLLGSTIQEDRILQEIALIADKTDITEEIVRFRSHVVQLKNTLMKDEPIGRKLDFIIQEMNREVNTIGSKAMDIKLTDYVVQLKCELEKVREQVQNIE